MLFLQLLDFLVYDVFVPNSVEHAHRFKGVDYLLIGELLERVNIKPEVSLQQKRFLRNYREVLSEVVEAQFLDVLAVDQYPPYRLS